MAAVFPDFDFPVVLPDILEVDAVVTRIRAKKERWGGGGCWLRADLKMGAWKYGQVVWFHQLGLFVHALVTCSYIRTSVVSLP